MRRIGLSGFAAMIFSGSVAAETSLLDWSELHGWSDDDHTSARAVFLETCGDLSAGDWPAVCALAAKKGDPRLFFETLFRPVLISDGEETLFTGYFEPEVDGSRSASARFRYPLYQRPADAPGGEPWLSREEIETTGVLENRGLEIVWLEDPVEKFFLQIQGSGRINLEEGGNVRVGYGGKNGHPYRSVGVELVRRGVFEEHEVSAQTIRRWVSENPVEGEQLLRHNPSYVFFREVSEVPADKGPLGAMNRSVTAGRSLAVDPEYEPLGAPVWVEKNGESPIRRLMIAQDTGSAIRGPQRADIFFGTGSKAGDEAGRIKDGGRMVVLFPIEQALELTGGS
ncbi:MAG: murein transglycosylase [Silicimonas sp.]|nr:murein transglycosylase [Silicimonas sp.]